MDILDAARAKSWFAVLATTDQSQVAAMTLEPGKSSGEKGNEHPDSDQVLVVLAGEVLAEIGKQEATLRAGQAVVVPAGASHRFTNEGKVSAVTLSVYAPPAYDPDETG